MLDLSFQDTISGFKIVNNIIKNLFEIKSVPAMKEKITELQAALVSAQSNALAAQAQYAMMIEEIRDLKEEIARVKAWEAEKQRYKLTSAWLGIVLYAVKKSMSGSEPPHWICTKCYEDGRKSILNPRQNAFWTLCCPTCKSEFHPGSVTSPPKPEYVAE